MRFTTLCGGLCQTAYLGANCSHTVHNLIRENSRIHRCPQNRISNKPSHHRTVCGFFNVPRQYCETWPTVYRPYPRRLESLTICRCHHKYSTDPECWSCRGLNLRPPARQSGALLHVTELTGRGCSFGHVLFKKKSVTPPYFYISDIANSSSFSGKILRKIISVRKFSRERDVPQLFHLAREPGIQANSGTKPQDGGRLRSS